MIAWITFALVSGILEARYYFRNRRADIHKELTAVRMLFAWIVLAFSGYDIQALTLVLTGSAALLMGYFSKSIPLRMSLFILGFLFTVFSIIDLDFWRGGLMLLSMALAFPFFHDGAIYSTYFYLRYNNVVPLTIWDYLSEFYMGYSSTSTSYLNRLGVLCPVCRLALLVIAAVVYLISVNQFVG